MLASAYRMVCNKLNQGTAVGDENLVTLAALLWVMVLHNAPPPTLIALLLCKPMRVVKEGARLEARLPAYVMRRWVLLDAHCSLVPTLQILVHSNVELTTTEEL